jgi:hypothetical protein
MDSVQNRGTARRIAVGLVVAAIATVGLGFGAATLPAHAATTHRAAMVVEVDGVIHTAKVTFAADSISGLDALRDAGFNPHVRVFGGNGGAVCALDVGTATIGCPADSTCLTCDAHSAYWEYWRAPAGATSYTYSVVGAGNSQVHDGDVEAWVWGTGSPPTRFVSFRDVWGPDPTTTTRPRVTTTPSTAHSATTTPVTVGGLVNPTPPPITAPSGPTVPTTTVPKVKAGAPTTARRAAPSTSESARGDRIPTTTARDRRIAAAPVVAHGGGGSMIGLVGFAVILVVLVGAIVFARRRRSAIAR